MKRILTILFAAAFFLSVVAISQEQPKKETTKPATEKACAETKDCPKDSDACKKACAEKEKKASTKKAAHKAKKETKAPETK
jgi:Ni/Co efflux regulator RcnB